LSSLFLFLVGLAATDDPGSLAHWPAQFLPAPPLAFKDRDGDNDAQTVDRVTRWQVPGPMLADVQRGRRA
jgi:hypothetical protein